MERSDFRFFERLRVRWAEIDAQQIVFNGHYLMYFDTAIAGYWRALAMPYHETMQALGGDLFVRKATLEYLGSAAYDDVLEIGLRCARIGNSSIVFLAGAFRQEQPLVIGELVYVFADPNAKEPRPVPAELRKLFESYEAGEPMVQVRVGSWRELEAAARPIRAEVFVAEQKIPAEMEWDDADPAAVCSSMSRASPRSAAWRWRRARAIAASAAPFSMRCSTLPVRAAIARRCCTPSSARRASTSAPDSCAAGPISTRRGSPTSR
jgi:YbgC/YbaW family acyl-CoA thioester hydrolase